MQIKNLFESVDTQEIMSQPFMTRFPTERLYRGLGSNKIAASFMPFRFREVARDTDASIHDAVNILAMQEFGIPVRNLMFCTFDENIAMEYGNAYMIIPKGDYTLYYNPAIIDFTGDLDAGPNGMQIELIVKALIDDLDNDLGTINTEDGPISVDDVVSIDKPFYTVAGLATLVANSLDSAGFVIEEKDVYEYTLDAYNRMLGSYLSDMEAITTEDEIDLSHMPEVMLHAPNGFYIIPDDEYSRFN